MGAAGTQQKVLSADGRGQSEKIEEQPPLPKAPDIPTRRLSRTNAGSTGDWSAQTGGMRREGNLVEAAAAAVAANAGKTAPGFQSGNFSTGRPPPLSPAAQLSRAARQPATWVQGQSKHPATPPVAAAAPQSKTTMNLPADLSSPWTCQICGQREILASAANCPTCGRPRGLELRRNYMTTTELTQSIVDAVNDTPGVSFHSGGSASSTAKWGAASSARKGPGNAPKSALASASAGYGGAALQSAATTAPVAGGKVGQGGKLSQAGRGVAGPGKSTWLGRDVTFEPKVTFADDVGNDDGPRRRANAPGLAATSASAGSTSSSRGSSGGRVQKETMSSATWAGRGSFGEGGGGGAGPTLPTRNPAANSSGLGLTSDFDALDRELDRGGPPAFEAGPSPNLRPVRSLGSLLAEDQRTRSGARVEAGAADFGRSFDPSSIRGARGGPPDRPEPPHNAPEPLLLPNPGADRLPSQMSRSSSMPATRGRTDSSSSAGGMAMPPLPGSDLRPPAQPARQGASAAPAAAAAETRGGGDPWLQRGPAVSPYAPAASSPPNHAAAASGPVPVSAQEKSSTRGSSGVQGAKGASTPVAPLPAERKAEKQMPQAPEKAARPARTPVDANMDVEALLQAQKKRIDGLKTRLTMA